MSQALEYLKCLALNEWRKRFLGAITKHRVDDEGFKNWSKIIERSRSSITYFVRSHMSENRVWSASSVQNFFSVGSEPKFILKFENIGYIS